ncbi:MAG: hypothetical protein U0905_18295 [Pirellulales bacterium]
MDSSAEDFEWDDALPYHPPPKWRLFLGAALVVAAVALSRLVMVCLSKQDMNQWLFLALPVSGMAMLFALERPSITGPWAHRLGWGFVVGSFLPMLLSWVSQSDWAWVSLSLVTLGTCLYFYPDCTQHRAALLAILLMQPICWLTSPWQALLNGMHLLIARLTGALLDGIEVAHERRDTMIRMVHGSMDTTQFTSGPISLEWIVMLATLYALIRKTPVVPWIVSCLTLGLVWMSLRSSFWALYGYSIEHRALETLSLETYYQVAIGLGVVTVVGIEFFFSRLFAPMRRESVATEFPLFVEIYNVVSSFPNRGFASLTPEESFEEGSMLEGGES